MTTLEDLCRYYPRDYEDRKQLGALRSARVGFEMTLKGKIESVTFQETRRGFAVATAVLSDPSGELAFKWLRKASFKYDVFQGLRRELQPGYILIAHGKINLDFHGPWMQVDDHEVLSGAPEDLVHVDRIVPIYASTEGLKARFIRKLTHAALEQTKLADPLPPTVPRPDGVIPYERALQQIHFPDSFEEKDRARTTLAFEELFMTQTVMAIARRRRRVPRDFNYSIKKNLLTPFKQHCGFEFTAAQKKVINEIFGDLTSGFPMNRLLQGDVGSGKTVVAISAMLLAVENGLQAALLAPTEILAEQHSITLKHILDGLPVKVGLLTGSATAAERKQFLTDLAEGTIDIAVGTHALLEDRVHFKHCGLVVIDEQHRFGVRHRESMTRRHPVPDVLVMTATPIPRTLALGLYGDLDVSTIDQMPAGRQKILTSHRTEEQAYQKIKEEVAEGRQAYIVYPLVDESDKMELKSAIREFENLKARAFKGYSVGLLHGQMSGNDKEKAMMDFKSGKFSILIATTVIEVGIDVPNATVMVIQNAERFGLSTLHQLRGRIGRGPYESYCILVAQPKTPESSQRLQIFLETNNGFRIAEADLALRGPGEIFGTSQHGLPDLKIADFGRDQKLIEECQKTAREWIDKDPDLLAPENQALKMELQRRFAKTWHWATVA